MEYLATYGWALLAMFVVVATLVGTGMLGAGRFTSEECAFAPNLPCSSGYFTPVAGTTNKLDLFVNITNTQGYPMLITKCYFKLVGGDEADYIVNSPDCWREVPQGGWFNHSVNLTSLQRINAADMKKAYITYTFRNCQDLNWSDCYTMRAEHNTSGRLVASIRG